MSLLVGRKANTEKHNLTGAELSIGIKAQEGAIPTVIDEKLEIHSAQV
jgi:hypothetical protein